MNPNETPVAYEDNNTPWNQLYDTGGNKVDYLPVLSGPREVGDISTMPIMTNMETSNGAGFFENIISQTGESIGNLVVNTVNAGSTAINTAIDNLNPRPAPAPAPAPSAFNPQTMGLLAVAALVVFLVVKNQK